MREEDRSPRPFPVVGGTVVTVIEKPHVARSSRVHSWSFSIRKRLDRVLIGDQEGSKMPEPLKIGLTTVFKLVSQVIQIGYTILNDRNPLSIKPNGAIEEIYHASADHRIQCHQWPLILASHMRPALLLVGFPKGQYGISIHFRRPLQFRLSQPSASSSWTASVQRAKRQDAKNSFNILPIQSLVHICCKSRVQRIDAEFCGHRDDRTGKPRD